MSDSFGFGGEVVWRPSPKYTERSNLRRFMFAHGIRSVDELVDRASREVAWFTNAILSFLDVQFEKPYQQVLDLANGIERPVWCGGGRLNIVYNCLDKWAEDRETRDNIALIWEGEEGHTTNLTYRDMAREVNKCANALRNLGLKKGDGIGLLMPMTPEICIALLAVARIGGVILPLFSGYGEVAITSRLEDAGAKALFTADGFCRRGAVVPLKPVADRALCDVPTVDHVVVLRRAGNPVEMKVGRDHWWHEIVPSQPEESRMEATSAEDLLMIIYTSGTTGRPKGAVHTHCGFPVKAAQDMALGTDVKPGDLIYWMTDMGWMMGPWLLFGATLLGATFFLYDGAPDFPEPDRLWQMVEQHRITQLGISPTLIRALIPHGEQMVKKHDLSSLFLFASTGEPWNPDPWLWLFDVVGERQLPIINYSGGTEISGGIVMGNTLTPLKPASFSSPCPGIAADVVDELGHSVRNQVGELVIRAPWIGMTRGFWQDEKRYLDTYWSTYQNVWVHGDWAAIDEDGLWYILGRSDDTIKIAGKRLGPAEVESVLVNHPGITEAAAIGVPHEIKGSSLICFCILAPGYQPEEDLRLELGEKVAVELGKPLKPQEIWFVLDIPKTRNAKVMRRIVRSAYLGEDLGDISSLVNQDSLQYVKSAS